MQVCETNTMATKLLTFHPPIIFAQGKPVFPVDALAGGVASSLSFFINEKSWLLFSILKCRGGWLATDVSEWENDQEYCQMLSCIKDLKVVNDCAERCIKDITEYANAAKDSEYREDILVVATDHRGVFQDMRKQAIKNKNLTMH